MKKDFRLVLLGVICSIIFYSFLIFIMDFPKIQEQLLNFKIEYLPIILSLIFTGMFVNFFRWHLLVKNLGFKVPIKNNLVTYLSTLALAMTPGRAGDLFKSEILKKRHNIPRIKTVPLVLIERYYDVLGAVIAATVGIWYFQPAMYVMGVVSIFIFIAFLVFSSKNLFKKIISKLQKIKFTRKFFESLLDSYDVLHSSTRGKISIISTILSIIHWLLISLAVYFILLAYNIKSIGILEIIPIYLSSVVIGAVSFLPGGVGVTEGSLAGFLNLFIDDMSIAVSLSIIIRIFTLWVSVLVGFVFLKFVSDVFYGKHNDNTNTE